MPSDGSRTLWCRLDVQSISLYVGETGVLPCSHVAHVKEGGGLSVRMRLVDFGVKLQVENE